MAIIFMIIIHEVNMVRYTGSLKSITSDKLEGFFLGWPASPGPTTHLKLLGQSDEIILALDDDSGRVVGFITALSDRDLTAHIPLLELLPDYQGENIEKILLSSMLERLGRLYAIDLICDPEMTPFYERSGLRPATGMVVRHYENQAGSGS
jgi:ribosomal protein S18 acetylase RimI-like enzyme